MSSQNNTFLYFKKLYKINERFNYNFNYSIKYTKNSIINCSIDLITNSNDNEYNIYSKLNNFQVSSKIREILEFIVKSIDRYFQNKDNINHIEFLNIIQANKTIFRPISSFYLRCYNFICNSKKSDIFSYKQIAENINSKGYRAIGNAMKNNKFPILIPCHRVLSLSKNEFKLGGFLGRHSNLKLFNANSSNEFKFEIISKLVNKINARDKQKLDVISNELKIKLFLLYFEIQKTEKN